MKRSLLDAEHEPTDQQLSALMKEVATEVRKKAEIAQKKFFQQIAEEIAKKKVEWAKKYNISF